MLSASLNKTFPSFPCFQLQVLVDDSGRLQETYPGENADQIAQLQNAVVEQWGELQQRSEQRKDQLMAAAELHKFSAAVSHPVWGERN